MAPAILIVPCTGPRSALETTPASEATIPRTWRHRLPFFHGYVMVAIGFGMMFVSNGINWSLGVIAIPMRDDLDWTITDVFAGLFLRILMGALGAFALTRFADTRNGARRTVFITGIFICTSLALTSQVTEVWQFWLLVGVVTGFMSGGHALLFTAAVVPRWFRRYRGRAVAAATMGSSTAAFVLPTPVAFLVGELGWQSAWVMLACLSLTLSVLPSLLIVRQPEDLGMTPDGLPPQDASDTRAPMREEPEIDAHTAVRSRLFWLLVITVCFATTSSMSVPAIMAPMYEWKGFDATAAALGATIYGLFSMSSRFLWGWVADKVHIAAMAVGVGLFNTITFPLLIVLSDGSAYVFAAMVGVGVSGLVVVQSLVWPFFFGRRNLGAIVGVSRPFPVFMSAGGVLFMPLLFDATGSYSISLIAMSAAAFISVVFMLIAVRSPAPRSSA